MNNHGTETIAEIYAHIDDVLQHHTSLQDISDHQRRDIANALTARITSIFGGQQIYIPVGRSQVAEQRIKYILDRQHDLSAAELATELRVSIQYVYSVLRRYRRTKT